MSVVIVTMWVLMGLLAGVLAGFVTRAGGYGRKGDIVLGLAGSSVAGGLLWALGGSQQMVAVAVVAFLGATASIILQRTAWPLPVLTYWPRGR